MAGLIPCPLTLFVMTLAMTVRRCAIYVRKSSDEGLDMSYNSLEAQADACTAYVASQRHEGWAKLPKVYEGIV